MEFDGDLWTVVRRGYHNPAATNIFHNRSENDSVADHSQLPFNGNPILDTKNNHEKDLSSQPSDRDRYQEISRKVRKENLKNLNLERAKLVFHGVKRRRELLEIEISAEHLAIVDEWGWRKYGSKTTKASTHPKSYYKCNHTITNCQAKKYIQKASDEADRFIVSYIGKHNHDDRNRCESGGYDSRKRTRKQPQAMEIQGGVEEDCDDHMDGVMMIKQEAMEMEEEIQQFPSPLPTYNNNNNDMINWFLHEFEDGLQDEKLFAPDTSWSTIFWASALV